MLNVQIEQHKYYYYAYVYFIKKKNIKKYIKKRWQNEIILKKFKLKNTLRASAKKSALYGVSEDCVSSLYVFCSSNIK